LSDPTVIAVIEDDDAVREAFSDLLQALGFSCRAFDTAEAFLGAHESEAFGCLISDVRLPGISGLDLLRQLRSSGSTLPVIVVTAHMDPSVGRHVLENGAHACLSKPVAADLLVEHLRSVLSQ
jgi:FixJ family two-component response regulator